MLRPSEDEDHQGHLLGGGYGERAGAPRSGTRGSQASHTEYFQDEGLVGTPRALVSLGKAAPQHRAGHCWVEWWLLSLKLPYKSPPPGNMMGTKQILAIA